MSYKINTTDGRLLVDLVDGKVDTTTTDLNLIGKNVSGFGEFLNENFIKLAENFANSAAPSSPLTGQMWYDTSEQRLKVFNGTQFKPTDTTVVSANEPTLLAGDIWIDTVGRQLYFSDGNGKVLAGPIYTTSQGETGFKIETLFDVSGNSKIVAKLLIANSPVAIISKEEFTPSVAQIGFTGNIKAGFNISNLYSTFKFHGEAASAGSLTDTNGDPFSTATFLKTTGDNVTTGTLYVKNNNGIRFGNNGDHLLRVASNTVYAQNTLLNYNYSLQVTKNTGLVDALYVDTQNSRVGIFKNNPSYTLDVTGDLRVTGNLVVEGASITLDVATLQVQDKMLELAYSDPLLNDIQLDGAGILLRSSATDKSFAWNNSTLSLRSSEHISVATGKTYKIGATTVLSATALGSSISSATGLTQIGTLQSLDVDYINLNNATLTTTTYPLQITSAADIVVNDSRKITGVGDPTSSQDVATKNYVDTTVNSKLISLCLDITGLTNNQIASVINDVNPAPSNVNGTLARVHTFYYTGTSVTRGLKQFIVTGGAWTFNQDLVSSV
jgi:hypothetical protein